jgi:hypothetical protein
MSSRSASVIPWMTELVTCPRRLLDHLERGTASTIAVAATPKAAGITVSVSPSGPPPIPRASSSAPPTRPRMFVALVRKNSPLDFFTI